MSGDKTKSSTRNTQHATVLAIAAHPDDIEFMMAGTLLMLKQAGCETHYLNIANGNCGSVEYNATTLRKLRATEARRAAKVLGATFHPSLTNDLEIFYDLKTVRRLAAVVREVKPSIVLTHSPQDYMEDHTNACRLAVTAAFAHGMPNLESIPNRAGVCGRRHRLSRHAAWIVRQLAPANCARRLCKHRLRPKNQIAAWPHTRASNIGWTSARD